MDQVTRAARIPPEINRVTLLFAHFTRSALTYVGMSWLCLKARMFGVVLVRHSTGRILSHSARPWSSTIPHAFLFCLFCSFSRRTVPCTTGTPTGLNKELGQTQTPSLLLRVARVSNSVPRKRVWYWICSPVAVLFRKPCGGQSKGRQSVLIEPGV